ncbi:DEKNAAC102007 [Brettanomyces naardenensis]|uniref:DEKNAAC102007 n=1 Tax=Brettanomyces naardenensis TaxID=13370 RepID=A0A448YJA8_BRENA|nr:DEKNAAC102007 [Brettanomyces naardenensis]
MGEDQQKYKVPNKEEAEEPIKYRTHGTSFYNLKLPENYRLGNEAMYQNPLINFVIGAKRLSLAFGVIGVLFGYLMDRTGLVLPEISQAVAVISVIPFPVLLYLYHPYVARVFRVYDTKKPQTMENLVKDERIILEKLNWNGFRTYRELVRVDSLRVPSRTDYENRFGFVNLVSEDPKTGLKMYYYINDGFCNVKMDRIISLAEKRGGIDNGRAHFVK